MTKQQSQDTFERVKKLMRDYAPQSSNWHLYRFQNREIRLYHADTSFNIIKLSQDDGQFNLILEMHKEPNDKARLRYANELLDTAELMLKNGEKV